MRPPTAHSVIASSVNCVRIVCLIAPIALLTPISRVRSVTLTSMMFITPTPPTSRRHRSREREHQPKQSDP